MTGLTSPCTEGEGQVGGRHNQAFEGPPHLEKVPTTLGQEKVPPKSSEQVSLSVVQANRRTCPFDDSHPALQFSPVLGLSTK